MKVSAFIQKLLLVALHQGHLALRDPSIGMDQLQRPFGLIFSMMSRETPDIVLQSRVICPIKPQATGRMGRNSLF
jgi:hypothetical protein